MMRRAPVKSARRSSTCWRSRPGLRLGLSRHCSVGDQRALAVDMDRAAFADQRSPIGAHARGAQQSLAQRRIVCVRMIFVAPGIELPGRPAARAVGAHKKGRADVAGPGIVERPSRRSPTLPAQASSCLRPHRADAPPWSRARRPTWRGRRGQRPAWRAAAPRDRPRFPAGTASTSRCAHAAPTLPASHSRHARGMGRRRRAVWS